MEAPGFSVGTFAANVQQQISAANFAAPGLKAVWGPQKVR